VKLIATVIQETYDKRFTKALNHDDVLDRLGHQRLHLGDGRSDQDMPLSPAKLHRTLAFSASASKHDRHNRCRQICTRVRHAPWAEW
jgi:hypothetical protein